MNHTLIFFGICFHIILPAKIIKIGINKSQIIINHQNHIDQIHLVKFKIYIFSNFSNGLTMIPARISSISILDLNYS